MGQSSGSTTSGNTLLIQDILSKWLTHVPSQTSPISPTFQDQWWKSRESPELPVKQNYQTLWTKKMPKSRLERTQGKPRLLPEGFHSKSSKLKLPLPLKLRRNPWSLFCPLA